MPITGAEQTIQIGPLVLAKNPTYGDKQNFKYADGGEVTPYHKQLAQEYGISMKDGGEPDEPQLLDTSEHDMIVADMRKRLEGLQPKKENPFGGLLDSQQGFTQYRANASIPIGEAKLTAGFGGDKMKGMKPTATQRHFALETPFAGGNLKFHGSKDPFSKNKEWKVAYERSFKNGGRI